MTVTTRHVFWGTAVWVISSAACLSNDVQLVEISRGGEREPLTSQGSAGNGTAAPSGGRAATEGSGGSGALVNVAGGTGIGGAGDDAGTMVGSGGAEAVLAGGAAGEGAGEGGAAGASGDGGNAGGTSTCTPGVDCLTIQTRLPSPCAGIPYSELISISGGTGPYAVQLLSPPGEFELRQEGGEWRVVSTGSSGPSAGALLQVEVRDSGSPAITETVGFELALRESCWFAYLGEDGPALALVPITKAGPLGATLNLPSPDVLQGGRVVDFKFSPDGRRLAARWLDAGGTHRLMVFDAPFWRQSLASNASADIAQYAWSPDASVLAFATSDEGGTALGGARWGALATEPLVLAPLRIVVDSELFWMGSDLVAFHRADADEFRTLGYARMAAAGFEEFIPPSLPFPYSLEGLQLRPSPGGLFAIAPLDYGLDFFDATQDALSWTLHDPDVALSPSFEYTARTFEGVLLVYRAGGTEPGHFAIPLAERPQCQRLLTWSAQGDRILCATATSLDVLRVSETGARHDFTLMTHGGLHAFEAQRRVFSPGGRWLAYVIDPEGPLSEERGFLFIADMELGSIHPNVQPLSLNTEAQVELEFSPDDRWLFIHIGSRLRLLPLTTGYFSNQVLEVALEEPGPCSETFSDTQPPWCGARGQGRIRWSPESDIAAVLTASGAVAVVPPIALPQEPSPGMSVTCGATCRYEFQPKINQEGL